MANWNYNTYQDPNALSQKGKVQHPADYPSGSPSFSSYGQIDQGYYVQLPDTDPADLYPSGFLSLPASSSNPSNPGGELYLWITQAQISLSAAGSFAQSARLREFFPRNFVQPVWNIQGICPNSFQLQRLGEFIRLSQFYALNPTSISSTSANLVTLHIYDGHLGDLTNISDKNLKKLHPRQQNYIKNNPTTAVQGKGPHPAQIMQGYINNFSVGAQKFVNAPTYELDFTVAFSQGDLIITQNWSFANTKLQENTNVISYGDLGTGQTTKNSPPVA